MRHGHTHPGPGRRFARGTSGGHGGPRHEHGPEHGHEHGPGHGHEHGPGDHGRRRHGRGGGRAERLFDPGELRLVMLALIAERPRHGYEVIKEIEDRTAGTYTPSPGVVYPTLTLLEELGHATVAEEGGRKRYAATAEGAAQLAVNRAAADAALNRMQAVSAAHGGGPAPEIVRATENLRMALRLRLGRGPLGEDQVRAVAAALDAAAVAVERI